MGFHLLLMGAVGRRALELEERARALRARALSFYTKCFEKWQRFCTYGISLLHVAILKGQRQILDTNRQYFGRRAKRGGFLKKNV